MCILVSSNTTFDPAPMFNSMPVIPEGEDEKAPPPILPLTRDNLLQHSAIIAHQQPLSLGTSNTDSISGGGFSPRPPRNKRLSGDSFSSRDRRRSSRETNNVMIDMLPLSFPYHNDDIFIPAAESGFTRYDSPSSVLTCSSCSLTSSSTKYRRISSSVWWHEHGRYSRRPSAQTTQPSALDASSCAWAPVAANKLAVSKRIRRWCRQAWRRLLHPRKQ